MLHTLLPSLSNVLFGLYTKKAYHLDPNSALI